MRDVAAVSMVVPILAKAQRNWSGKQGAARIIEF